MWFSPKIRLIVLTLSVGLAIAALMLNYSMLAGNNGQQEATILTERLHQKERWANRLLRDTAFIRALQKPNKSPKDLEELITRLSERNLYIQTFSNGIPGFYNNLEVYLNSDKTLREGSSFIHTANGYYEALTRRIARTTIVCYIPIKSDYPYLNQYLQNDFSSDLIQSTRIDIVPIDYPGAYFIRDIAGNYLFAIGLTKKPGAQSPSFPLQHWLWIISLLLAAWLFTQCCKDIARSKGLFWGLALLTSGIVILRVVVLLLGWGKGDLYIPIRHGRELLGQFFSPTLHDLFLHIICFTWLLWVIHRLLVERNWPPNGKHKNIIGPILILSLWFGAWFFQNLVSGLIYSATINLDLSNVINLSGASYLGILSICLGAFTLYLLIKIVLNIAQKIATEPRACQVKVIVGLAALCATYQLMVWHYSPFYTFFPLVLVLYCRFHNQSMLHRGGIPLLVLVFSVVLSLQLVQIEEERELESRKRLAQRLESPEDPAAIRLFKAKEHSIAIDPQVIDIFQNPLASLQSLNNRLEKLYFDGYLSRYSFKAFAYFQDGTSIETAADSRRLKGYQDLLKKGGAHRVSTYFYKVSNSYGFQSYFALLPIRNKTRAMGTLLIELGTKPMEELSSFPQLVMDGKVEVDLGLGEYSYAFYHVNELIDQHGEYIYDLMNKKFGKSKDRYQYFIDTDYTGKQYHHLIYRVNEWKVIVVSKRVNSIVENLASIALLFLHLLFFTGGVFVLLRLTKGGPRGSGPSWRLNLLYKTRIQLSLLLAVIFTLSITGVITFLNMSKQYRDQQEKNILNKVKEVAIGIKKQFLINDSLVVNEQTGLAMQRFADISHADISLFDTEGNMRLSTQPKFYESGLVVPKMNPMAFEHLHQLQVSEYMGHEKIGKLKFLAGYVPIKNNQNATVAYIGFPYFSNEQDYQSRIGAFVNTLINVYTLILILIGILAIFIANQITYPLNIIQKSLSTTKIGQKNRPIKWRTNDEIGNLIKEYNHMIVALEDSAKRLAQSERETAWKEMAKQVAHEIKNPLTPLKLGVQLLKKSWEEKDSSFDTKFAAFSQSFIEQIESLEHIASAFSNFAKMPATVLRRVNLLNILNQSIAVYQALEGINLTLELNLAETIWVKADKDQLLLVFNNLIKNAVEATPANRNTEIRITVNKDPKWVYIELKDNGVGIDEALCDRIFTPNFTTKTSGTGLGLAFVKQSLNSIGAEIQFKTLLGQGTTFYIRFPLYRK